MSKIIELSSEIVPLIAAGEVVERPASVVKELIENSIDANASFINIEIEDVGLKLIRVIDDGVGMDADDLLKCFLSHTTSKIYNGDDLLNIVTFGFRGEALASISYVSNLSIKSKTKDSQTGNEILIKNGVHQKFSPVGMFSGTVVEVRDLFADVPARKKFLKSKTTEYKNILDIVVNNALAFPEIKFRFSHDEKVIFDLPKQTLAERAISLLGNDLFNNLLDFSFENERLNALGYLSKPQVSSSSKEYEFIFVNKRPVYNLTIFRAIRDAYGKLIDAKSFPPFVLFLNFSNGLVDVNIHPRKEEIRLWDDTFVYEEIFKYAKDLLDNSDLTFKKGDDYDYRSASEYQFLKLKDATDKWDFLPEDESIVQINNTYLAVAQKEGLLLIDQHAAHEAILYENYLEEYKNQITKGEKFELENPPIINLPISASDVLEDNISLLEDLGFEIEKFGHMTFRVLSVPKILKNHNVSNLINELVEDLIENEKIKNIDSRSEKTISFLACRSAIKAGEKLSLEEKKSLVEKLEKTKNLYTCPHGRPIKVLLTKSELEKLFRRRK